MKTATKNLLSGENLIDFLCILSDNTQNELEILKGKRVKKESPTGMGQNKCKNNKIKQQHFVGV